MVKKLTWAKTEINKQNNYPFKPKTNLNIEIEDPERDDIHL